MKRANKIIGVSQPCAPDPSTTATFMTAIAKHLAAEFPVAVLSGWRSSGRPRGVEIRNWLSAELSQFLTLPARESSMIGELV